MASVNVCNLSSVAIGVTVGTPLSLDPTFVPACLQQDVPTVPDMNVEGSLPPPAKRARIYTPEEKAFIEARTCARRAARIEAERQAAAIRKAESDAKWAAKLAAERDAFINSQYVVSGSRFQSSVHAGCGMCYEDCHC